MLLSAVALVLAPLSPAAAQPAPVAESPEPFGTIGRIVAVPGKRDALLAILLEGSADMPGCLSYIVARDSSDPDAIWVSEAWESRESHAASLKLPQVRAAIERARPLIAGFDSRVETVPAGDIVPAC